MSPVQTLRERFPAGTDEGLTLDLALAVRSHYKRNGLRGCLEEFYWIKDKVGDIHPIELNWAQLDMVEEIERQLDERGWVRIIILKARQLGMSTLIQGVFFILALLKANRSTTTLSHEGDSAKYILGMARRALDRMTDRPPFPMARDSRGEMKFLAPVHSEMIVKTAGNVGSGRSFTSQALHASEVAFYPDASTLMLGMLQTLPYVPGTYGFMESTANGVGNYFYQQWTKAESKDPDAFFAPKFYPWQLHPEYRIEFTSAQARTDFLAGLSQEEERMLHLGVDPESLRWRRMAIINNCEGDVKKFQQEYPMTPEEAFLTSGRPTFDASQMQKLLRLCRETKPVRVGYWER